MGRVYKELPSATELWEHFEYNPLTGVIYRKGKAKPAGHPRKDGYWFVGFDYDKILRHRLVYVWVTGTSPGQMIVDHINRTPGDDRAWNLRLATPGESSRNVSARGTWQRSANSFQAKICVDRKIIRLGSYPTEAEAKAAYIKASQELHGSFSPYSK